MKALLACFGAIVLIFIVLGSIGIGNFVIMYSPDPIECTKR